MRRHLLILTALCAVTFFTGLDRPAITDSDEAFYAESAREMRERRDWLTPYFNDELRFQKPVLYYWLAAASYAVAGVSPAAARFPAALSGLGLVLATYWCGRRWWNERVGWLAAAMTASSAGCALMARLALPDLPLALFVSVTTFSIFEATGAPLAAAAPSERARRGWLAMAGLAAGLGFLTKGPVAIALPLLSVAPSLWLERPAATRLRVRPAALALGVLVFAAVALPWFVAMGVEHGPGYLQRFFLAENLDRFATTRYNDHRPFWYYAPIVLGGFLPWSPLLVLGLPHIWDTVTRVRRPSLGAMRCLAAVVIPLAFYSASIGKQPRYILPVLPPLALLVAAVLSPLLSRGSRPDRALGILASLAAANAIVLTLAVVRLEAILSSVSTETLAMFPASTVYTGAVIALALAGCAIWLAWRGPGRLLAPALTAAAVAAMLTAQFGVMSTRQPEAVEQLAEHLMAQRRGEPIGTYRTFVRNLVFYGGIPTTDLSDEAALLQFLGRNERVLCVVSERHLRQALGRRPVEVIELARTRYFNPAALRLGTLVHPRPDRDVDSVLLIANRQ